MIENKRGMRLWPCALAGGFLLCAASAGAADVWTSSAYVSVDFGGSHGAAVTHLGLAALPRDWRADVRALNDRRQFLPAVAAAAPLSLDYAPAQQLSLRLLNSDIAGFRFTDATPRLNQTDAPAEAQPAAQGNWFSRNWWEIGLGVVGTAVLATGGSHTDINVGRNGSETNGNSSGNGGGGVTGVGGTGILCVNGVCAVPCGPDNVEVCVVPP